MPSEKEGAKGKFQLQNFIKKMEEKIFAEYPIDGKVYQLLQEQPFVWSSKVKKADGNFKYASQMQYDKEALKRCPDVVVELSVLNPELIRVKAEKEVGNRGIETPNQKIKAEEQKGTTS